MISGLLRLLIFSFMIVAPDFTGKREISTPTLPSDSVVPELTLENVYRELLYQDIKHPDIVLRQVICETMWLKCRKCSLKFNNLFGFTTRRGYMKFKNWVDCIKFYKQWQGKWKVTGNENYYKLLKRARFAVFEDYNKRLKSIIIKDITSQFEIPQVTLPNPVEILVHVGK